VYNCEGVSLSSSRPSMNFRIYWDGDLQDELLDGATITKYNVGNLMSATNCSSINGTKSTPCLSADILGDWREEVIFRTTDNKKLRIYTTTIPTSYKMYTLMHDAQYRDAVAWQNTAYNQPPHCGFYIGDDMQTAPVSAIYNNEKRWSSGTTWDNNITASWTDSTSTTSTFKNGDGVLFDITASANALVNVSGNLTPKRVKVNSPFNVVLSGTGTLNGGMDLKKIGAGSLTLNNNNSYTGSTDVWDGDFYNNGILSNSEVTVYAFVKLSGSGTFGNNVTLGNLSSINPGNATGETSKLTFSKGLNELGTISYTFDIAMSSGKVVSSDTIIIGGDWTMSGKSTINLNTINGALPAGDYILARCAGTINGDLSKIKIAGYPSGLCYLLLNVNGNLILRLKAPSNLIWQGNVDGNWDNGRTSNWLQESAPQTYISNDSVNFNESSDLKSVVINESVLPSSVTMDATSNYTFSGTGSIEGFTGLTKNGTGKLTISNSNKYTGKTIINNGTIEFATLPNGEVASAIGAATIIPDNIQLNGGKLSLTGNSSTTDRGLTLGQNGGTISIGSAYTIVTTSGKITGVGKLIKDGVGRLSLSSASDYKGGTLIKTGSITLLNDIANTSGLGSDTITFQGGSLYMFDSNATDNTSNWKISVPKNYTGKLTVDGKSTIAGSITGAGTLYYNTNFTSTILTSDVSKFTGTINVLTGAAQGNFVVYNSKGYANTKINLGGLIKMMYYVTSNVSVPVGDLTGLANSELGAGGTGACTITWEVGARSDNSTFSGTISNAQYSGSGAVAAIKKVGTGTWTLTNVSTYAGGTNVNAGTLMVNNTSGSGLGTGNTTVNSGGILAGTGIVSGVVTVNDGGTISPANGTGTFTVNNNVNVLSGGIFAVDIDKTNSKTDLLSLTGTLNMIGKLQITALNGTIFADGDAFKIVNGTITGTPSEIIPATPGDGLAWDLSEFNATGTIKIKVSTGLNESQINSKVYPNPFNDKLRIQLGQTLNEVHVSVVNLIGEVVYLNEFNNTDQIKLNLDYLNKGVYLLQIKADKNLISKKIVKE